MPETGRKFWMAIIAMGVMSLRPEVAAEAVAVAIAFITGNAAVTMSYAKADATSRLLTGTSDIERRRDDALGIEPAP